MLRARDILDMQCNIDLLICCEKYEADCIFHGFFLRNLSCVSFSCRILTPEETAVDKRYYLHKLDIILESPLLVAYSQLFARYFCSNIVLIWNTEHNL